MPSACLKACAYVCHRLRLKKPPKKLSVAKSRKDSETAILRAFAKESEVNEVGVVAVAEAAERCMTLIDAHNEFQDHLHPDSGAHQATAALHHAVTSIPTFLLAGAVVEQTSDGVDHPLQRDQTHTLDHLQEPHRAGGIAMELLLDHGDANTPLADLEPLLVVVDIAGTGI